MAYRLPLFNLLANIWDCSTPADGDPTWVNVPCQKYIRSRMMLDVTPQAEADWWMLWQPPIQLRCPSDHAAFSGRPHDWSHTIYEVPAGSGQYYRIFWSELQHQGFPNEYAVQVATQCDDSGLAIAPAGATTIPTGVAAEVCYSPPPPPPPPPVEEKLSATFTIDSGGDDRFGICLRMADTENYYIALYDGGGGGCYIQKQEASLGYDLDNDNLANVPGHDATLDIVLTILDDSITARFTSGKDDITLTATDATFPEGGDAGLVLSANTDAVCNTISGHLDAVLTIQDLFTDKSGTNLTSHTMTLGTGWSYGGTKSDIQISAGGDAAIAITNSSTGPGAIAGTAFD